MDNQSLTLLNTYFALKHKNKYASYKILIAPISSETKNLFGLAHSTVKTSLFMLVDLFKILEIEFVVLH